MGLVDLIWCDRDGFLTKWRVRKNSLVRKGAIVAETSLPDQKIVSPVSGIFKLHLFPENASIQANTVIGKIELCKHLFGGIGNLCADCGETINSKADWSEIVYTGPTGFKMNKKYVETSYQAYKKELLQKKRLILLLDLDQTILHAIQLERVFSMDQNSKESFVDLFIIRPFKDRPYLAIKFRPGLRDFLLKIHELYEIRIFTMASSEYTGEIVRLILDEILAGVDDSVKNTIFGDRILTRTKLDNNEGFEDPIIRKKYIRKINPDKSIVVILDDSEVWPEDCDHLICLEKFCYFCSSEDVNYSYHIPSVGVKRSVGGDGSKIYSGAKLIKSCNGGDVIDSECGKGTMGEEASLGDGDGSLETLDAKGVVEVEVDAVDDGDRNIKDSVDTSDGIEALGEVGNGEKDDGIEALGEVGNNCGDGGGDDRRKWWEISRSETYGFSYYPNSNGDSVLNNMKDVLCCIHCNFFEAPLEHQEMDWILPRIKNKREVLYRCREYGAQPVERIEDATHFVYSEEDDENVINEAIRRFHLHAVHKMWLYKCIKRWNWEKEENYQFSISIKRNTSNTERPKAYFEFGADLLKGDIKNQSITDIQLNNALENELQLDLDQEFSSEDEF